MVRGKGNGDCDQMYTSTEIVLARNLLRSIPALHNIGL
jgi:hypothetical protein